MIPAQLSSTTRRRRRPQLFALAALGAACISIAAAAASDPRPMTVVDLLDVATLSSPVLSPDGSRVAFVRTTADWDANRRVRHIWMADVATGAARQVTFGRAGGDEESSPTWNADGSLLAFLAKRGDDEHDQVYVLPTRGGEARRLFEHGSSPRALWFSPDGKWLWFLANEPQTKEEKAKKKAQDDVIDYDFEFKQRHLWRLPLDERGHAAGDAERISEGDFSVTGYDVFEDDDSLRLITHRAPTPRFDDSDENELWRLDLQSSADADGMSKTETIWTRLLSNEVFESGAEWSPDGEWILFRSAASADFEGYHNGNLFLIPAAGGDTRLLLESVPYEINSARWTAEGNIVFLANTGVRSQLFTLDPESEEFSPLSEGDHATRAWDYLPELDQHVAVWSNASSPGDVSLRSADGSWKQITRLNDHYASDFRLPKLEAVSWKGEDGQEVEGLLWYPLDYQEGTRYPLVVQTHGGPSASDKFAFGRWINYPQVLTARGWMVFQPNYRGSTGYGDAFQRDMVGHYFNQSHLDVMTGVDALIERGLVDGERMAKMGWSAGGHMTNKIITHTDRFKAASSGAGAINWISMYGQSDVRIYRTPWFGDTPWTEDAPITNYWESSPLKDIWRVTTPTLVLVGQNDLRVPAAQSIELFRALQSHDVPSHLYMAPRAGHGWRELRHELFKVNVELEWFEKWALGRDYEWEKAPGEEDDEETADEPTSGATSAAGAN